MPERTAAPGATGPGTPARAVVESGSNPATWLPLNPPTRGGFGSLTVNAPRGGLGTDPRGAGFENFWSARSVQDLRAIAELRRENQALRMALSQASRQVAAMQASLDSTQRAPHHHREEAANR